MATNSNRVTMMDVERATNDLKNRTLARLAGGEIAQLVFLASTRNYNTGEYRHDGLAFRYDEHAVSEALASCHQEAFTHVAHSAFRDVLRELELYINSTKENPTDVLSAWQKLESYRVTIPIGCDPYDVDLFFSNVKVALAALLSRQAARPHGPQFASRLRSLGR